VFSEVAPSSHLSVDWTPLLRWGAWRKEACSDAREGEYLGGTPDKIDQGLSYFREEVQPEWETDPGFKGAVSLNDRQNGRTLAITFWESEEHMRAMEEDAHRVRSKVAETAGREIVSVERYEVGLFELKG
jgi:heme-degrading monooxygenase HmoA